MNTLICGRFKALRRKPSAGTFLPTVCVWAVKLCCTNNQQENRDELGDELRWHLLITSYPPSRAPSDSSGQGQGERGQTFCLRNSQVCCSHSFAEKQNVLFLLLPADPRQEQVQQHSPAGPATLHCQGCSRAGTLSSLQGTDLPSCTFV